MRIVFFSDTHRLYDHPELVIPAGDILVFAGDMSARGTQHECKEFMRWFRSLPHKHKIFIAGNHDFMFESDVTPFFLKDQCEGMHYLEMSSVEIEGLTFWGAPQTPYFYGWAFNVRRGKPLEAVWSNIPDKVDIVITHGPAHNILDKTQEGVAAGCEELAKRLEAVDFKLHVSGHIHEGYGYRMIGDKQYINASVLNRGYELVNQPHVFDWDGTSLIKVD